MDDTKLITVGELRTVLSGWDDDDRLFFGDGGTNTLTFYRIKNRGAIGEPLLQVEFKESFKIEDFE